MASHPASVLIIYTGGTIGMMNDPETGALVPFNFGEISRKVPELKRFGYNLQTLAFEKPIDSSDLDSRVWVKLAQIIKENYPHFDGFVVLHGTDTMAYSASALSFMLENQQKPVIFTGSQLPIGTLRTDGKENLITSIEIAAARQHGQPLVPEVCIYFENKLFRGNRTRKHNAEHFDAFRSDNYPPLAQAGISIKYNYNFIHYPTHQRDLKIHTRLDNNIAILKVFPSLNRHFVEAVFSTKGLRAVVLETFGAGNAPTSAFFVDAIKKAIQNRILVLNVSQCSAGSVQMGRYETSVELQEAGVVGGYDITTEAAVTKLMFLLGQKLSYAELAEQIQSPISGEISQSQKLDVEKNAR